MKKKVFFLICFFLGITGYTTLVETLRSLPKRAEEVSIPRQSASLAKLAIFNDRLLFVGGKYSIRAPFTAIASRVIAIPVFAPFLVADLYYSTKTLFCCKEDSGAYLARAKKCALGLLATPMSFFSPDFVTHHFIPDANPKQTLHSYGKLYSSETRLILPRSIEEVQSAVKKYGHITVAGAHFSQGKQALPGREEGIVLSLANMNGVSIDPKKAVAKVGAGARWKDIQDAANDHKLAVSVMQASNIFTVGGSLAINCHGWDHKAGAVSETVEEITIVNSKGEVEVLSSKDELFHFVIGGLGGFGVIVEAKIKLVPNTLYIVEGKEVKPSEYLEYFREEIQKNPQMGMHYYRLSLQPGSLFKEGIAVNYIDQGKTVVSSLKDECYKGAAADRIELHMLRRLKWMRDLAWKEEKREALKEVVLSRNEAMRPPINAIFNQSQQDTEWLQEFFVKPERLAGFLKHLSKVLDKNEVPVFNASVRYVAKNSSKALNYAIDGDTFAVVIFFNQLMRPEAIKKTAKWINEVVDYVLEEGGTYYVAYQNFPTVEQFRKGYPNFADLAKKKQEADPENVFVNGFYDEYINGEISESKEELKYFREVFSTQRAEMRDFIKVIFKQLDDEKLLGLVDSVLRNESLNDEQVYEILHKRIGEASPGKIKKTTQALKALKELQKDLSTQARELIGDRPLKGYVEIGYPGRMIRPLQKKLQLKGPCYVVNEKETLMDYIESGFPRPYEKFVSLNNFEPLSADEIPTESVDLVAMFIGLHHTPRHKLDAFVKSIRRVLRPGGVFLLMDHDARSEEMARFVSMVHTVFNLGTGVSPEEEKREYRNFRPLSYWKEVLARNGLDMTDKAPLIRDKDPTLNSLMTFTKPLGAEGEFLSSPGVFRSVIQTYLTAPEWQNVRSSQAYAEFIEHTPFYEFPYFSEIRNFWHVYKSSWKAARQRHSFWEVASSEYTLMNTFIGMMMSVEYGLKGIVSAPISWVYTSDAHKEDEVFHVLLQADHLPEKVQMVKEYEGGKQHVKIPRYREGTRLLIELAKGGSVFHSISGQKTIQIDLLVAKENLEGLKILYQTPKSADSEKKVVAVEVRVDELADMICQLDKQNIEISYIHEY